MRKIAFACITFLSGFALGRLIDIYNYFYDAKDKEGYFLVGILALIMLLKSSINFSFKQRYAYLYVHALVIGLIALTSSKFIYFISGYNDWSGLICMLLTVIIAMAVPLSNTIKNWALAVVLLALGIWLGFIIDSKIIALLIVLGMVTLFTAYYAGILKVKKWSLSLFLVGAVSTFFFFLLPEVKEYESQNTYYDKVVFSHKTRLQQIDITEWKGHHWFYYDKIKYLSSVDEWMYFEPLVHPVMHMHENPKNILVIGGENGCTIRELEKYKNIKIDQLPFDQGILELAINHTLFRKINGGIYQTSSVNIVNSEIFTFLSENKSVYDVIIVDLPDPIDIEVNQFYTQEFYALCTAALTEHGLISTQAGSPYFASKAYLSVDRTMQAGGLKTIMMHNQIPSLGEWGWIIGHKGATSRTALIDGLDFTDIETTWLDQNALKILFSFGKINVREESIKINTLKNPVTHKLYKEGDLKIN